MNPKRLDNKGNSLVELIMVMMLLVLFGVTIGAIVMTGSQAQSRIQERKNAQVDARIALSYITVKLRQHDKAGAVIFTTNLDTGKAALVIRNTEADYEEWIYFSDGHLYEFLGDIGQQPIDDYAYEIVDVKGIALAFDASNGTVRNTVTYETGGETHALSNAIRLRAGVTND